MSDEARPQASGRHPHDDGAAGGSPDEEEVVAEGPDVAGLVGAGIAVVLWASSFVGIRAVAPDVGAGSLALARLLIGSIVLTIPVALRGWFRMSRRDLLLVLGSGLIWYVTYYIALNESEQYLDAGTASMIVNTAPILIALLAGLFLDEGLPGRLLGGCVIAFAGAVLIAVGTSGASAFSATPLVGVALAFGSALSYAVGTIIQKPLVGRIPSLHVAWLATVAATVVCLPFAPRLAAEVAAAPPSTVAWLAYLGLLPTAVAAAAWSFALRRTPAGALAVTTYLIPPLAIVMSWGLLGEIPALLALAGGALCVAGVVFGRSGGSGRSGRSGARRSAGATDTLPT